MGLIESVRSFFSTKASTGVANGNNEAGQAVFKDWDDAKAIKEGYLGSTYVYKAIDWQAKIASVRLDVFKYIGTNDDKEEVTRTPLNDLLERPNPVMSWTTFLTRLVQFRAISGNALILKVRGSGDAVLELWPVPPMFITPVADETLYSVKEYKYQNGSEEFIIPKEDIIHWQAPDPSNALWGASPIKVAAQIIDTDNQAVLWNRSSMVNRAGADGVMTTSQDLTEDQHKAIINRWKEQRSGARNAMKTMFLSGGWNYQRMSMTSQEMDFIASRKFNREEITSTFGVPLILMGIMEGATFANYKEARLSFWEDTATPLLDDFIDLLNHSLVNEFDSTYWIEANYMSVPALKERQLGYVETALKYQEYGHSMNKIDDVLGLGFGDVPNGDLSYVRSNLIPVDMVMQEAPAVEDDETVEDLDAQIEDSLARLRDTLPSKKLKSGAMSDEQKELYWKGIELKRTPFDSTFKADVAKQFIKEGKIVSDLMKSKGKSAAKNYIKGKTNRKEWLDIYTRNYKRIIARFGQEAEEQLKGISPNETKAEPFNFDPYDVLVTEFIQEAGAQKVTNILDTTRSKIAKTIESGIAGDFTTDDIAKNLAKNYQQMSIRRAFVIARTEVAAASNFSLYAAGKQAPFKVRKTWVNSKDDRVRKAHQFTSTVDMDEKFGNGLEYPGDPSGAAREVIQCRCTIAYGRAED